MTDTDSFAKAMMSPVMEQGQERKKKVDENKLNENQSAESRTGTGVPGENQPTDQPTEIQPARDQSGKDANEQNGQATAKVDPAPQNDDNDNDMSLVDEARGAGLGVNTRGLDGETLTRDELDKKYSEMAAEIGEKAQARRDATPKATEQTEEKRAHSGEISRLENEYGASVNWDETAAMERVGAKEVLEVPNYREHVTDDQMQGWGRALASFGSVGLKEGANAIDAATKTLGEFRKLTRAFLSPNPMSPISQAVASAMVGFNTMYDAIDRAGEIAGIKQGADKSIVMETARGAQYYKDKDNATKVANYIMQTFNDQIRDTLGPGGDVTQLNPAQFTRIYGKMKEGFFDSEIERIKHKYSTGQPLSLEDKAIVNGWDNLNKNYHKVLKDKEKTAKEYAREIGGHERAINALDRQYDKDVKAYDKVIAGIDKDEFNQQRSLGADYTKDLKDLGGKNRNVDAWKAGFDDAVRNKDQVGALIRMTLGPEANRRLRNGNVLLETLKGAQDQANSNATNPNFTPEQQEKWLKIASVFGKRVQTVRNMSVEQRKQYALRLSGTPKTSTNAPKGRSSKGKTLTYTPLMSTKDMQAALNKTSGAYVADKLSGWMDDHRYSVYWGGDSARAGLYNATKDLLKDIYGREYEAYRALGTDRLSGEDLKTRRAELKGLYNKVRDMENRLDAPVRRRVLGNIRPDEVQREISNAQVSDKDRFHFSPYAIGNAMRELDTQEDKDKFIERAMREVGVLVPDSTKKRGYKASLDKLKDFLNFEIENIARDPEAFDALFTTLSRYQWGPNGRDILNGYRDRVTDMLQSMWNFEGTENPAPEGKGAGAGDGPGDKDRKEDRGDPGDGDGPGGQGDVQEEKEQEGYQAKDTDETPVEENAREEVPVEEEGTEEEEIPEENGRAMALERLEERKEEEEPAEETVSEGPEEEIYTDSDERLDAEQSENGNDPAEKGGESADTVEIAREPSVSTNMEYKSKAGQRYSSDFENVVNDDDPSLEKKIEGIDDVLKNVNRILDQQGLGKAIRAELEDLQSKLKIQRDEYSKKASAEFDQNQREENAKNLKAANEEGPNPEHGETFDADTSFDESKFKNPPEDPRREDSQKLSKELSGNEIMPKDIPEILRGIWPRGVKTIDGKVHGTGKGNNLNRVLTKAKDALADEVKRISALKEGPTDDDMTKLTEMRDNLIKTWDWIKDNMKNPSNYEKTRNSTFYGAKNPIDDATRLIEDTWTPWKSNDDTNPLPPPDGSTDTGSGEIEGQPKNTGRRKRTGKTKTGTGKSKQEQEELQEALKEEQKKYEDGVRQFYGTLDDLKEKKDKGTATQKDFEKTLGSVRRMLFTVLKNIKDENKGRKKNERVSLSDEFKKEFEDKFKEAGPLGHTIEFNWDAKDVSDLIKLTKPSVKRIPIEDKINNPDWTPTEEDKQYIQNHKMQIISTHFDGSEEKAKERFPFLKSAIPPFEELLRAKLNERYGPFIG